MKLGRSRNARQPMQARLLERQTNEILDLILSEVRLQSTQDLLSICLVSRQFYVLTIPHLYRNIILDLSRASHLRLLRRLERPDSHALKTIRHLRVVCADDKQVDHLDKVRRVFDGLVNLETFNWCSSMNMPVSMLDALHTRLSGARLIITYWREPKENPGLGAQPLRMPYLSIMDTAASMITSMSIILYEIDEHQGTFWAGFRKSLVGMVVKSTALTYLRIVAKSIGDNRCTTISQFMGAHTLPKLDTLVLNVQDSPIFSSDELQHWGSQGGWEDLTFLSLYNIHSLIPFVGRAPELESLTFLPRDGEDATELESRLNDFEGPSKFPSLRQVKVRSPWDNGLPDQYAGQVVPWYLLTLLPLDQLTGLNITRPWEVEDISSVPQAQDIRKIRMSCPNLEALEIDIWLPYRSDSGLLWPADVIRELSAFDKAVQLVIYPRGCHPTSEARLLRAVRKMRFEFRCSTEMAWCFWKECRRRRVLHKIPFSVKLIHSLRYESEEAEATKVLDINHLVEIRKCFLGVYCCLYWYSYSTVNRVSLDRMSIADLEEKTKSRWKCLWGDQTLYKREIRLRNNLVTAAPGGYENDTMLYDILMQSTVE